MIKNYSDTSVVIYQENGDVSIKGSVLHEKGIEMS